MSISSGRNASDQARATSDFHASTAIGGLDRTRGAPRPTAGHPSSGTAAAASHAPADAATTPTSSQRPWHRLDIGQLADAFDRLIEKTVTAAGAPGSSDQLDLTFGALGAIASFIHSARCHDGLMLQAGLALIAAEHPDLTVLTRDVELPVTDAAQALIARNRPGELSGIRLGSEVFAREHYRADLIIVDEARRYAVVCDVKRSIASYNAAKLGRLKAKLLACAVVAPDHLRTRHQIDGIRTCHAAILDLSGHADLADADVFGIDALDAFLRIDGAGVALHDLKRRFGKAVQDVLVEKLRAAFPQAMVSAVVDPDGAHAGLGESASVMDPMGSVAPRSADRRSGGIDPDDAPGMDSAMDRAACSDPDDPRVQRLLAMMPSVSVALARPVAGTA